MFIGHVGGGGGATPLASAGLGLSSAFLPPELASFDGRLGFVLSCSHVASSLVTGYLPGVCMVSGCHFSDATWHPVLITADKYETIDMVREALQTEGLESCNLIIGMN